MAKGLVAAGIEPGDRVALISKTGYEWTLLDYAIWFAGAATVPVYETSSAEQVAWILTDSGARAAVAESPTHLHGSARRGGEPRRPQHVWSIDDKPSTCSTGSARTSPTTPSSSGPAATPRDLATLIYTSGTTGRPKGCMLTHGNFMFEPACGRRARRPLRHRGRLDAAVPAARPRLRADHPGRLRQARARVGHSADIKNLVTTSACSSRRSSWPCRACSRRSSTAPRSGPPPTAGARSSTAPRRRAIAWSRGLDGGRVPLRTWAQHALFDRLVYGKLRTALGGSCAYAVSGGAPLGDRLGHFYRGIGVTVLEGYGLTETTAALTVNLPEAHEDRHGGRPVPGTPVRVADDGSCCSGAAGLRRLLAQRRGHARGARPGTAGSTRGTSGGR